MKSDWDSFPLVDKLSVEHEIRVRFAETDQAQVVYHANYFSWFQESRDACFRELFTRAQERNKGYVWSDWTLEMVKLGSLDAIDYRFFVIDVACRYIAPAKLGDRISILVTPCRSTVAKLVFRFAARNSESGASVAEAYTASAIVDPAGKMLLNMPPDFREIFHVA